MSINDINIKLIHMALSENGRTELLWNGKRMGELGNQKILSVDKKGHEKNIGSSKNIFSKKGIEHVSFDLNGKDESIPIDLCKPIPNKWIEYFDIVTNYGTTEHVENQYQVFKNIHDMTRIGGSMVHSIPLVGYWKNHCPYHYTSDFPKILSTENEYELSYFGIQDRHEINKLLNFILIKTTKEFQPFETFGLGIIYSPEYEVNSDNLFRR